MSVNSGKSHTISDSSLSAYLVHGDYLGYCDDSDKIKHTDNKNQKE
ncbi:MAG: hypothetical protein KGZ34_06630 [Nitrosarchaeum sp.]|nr:hypothetical protein [Nitrosarchaeum sp.]